MTRFKICGLTRPEDAAVAAEVGAAYLGVIFAGGPRVLDADRAASVLAAAGGHGSASCVGVMGAQSAAEIADLARAARLDAVQLHADPDATAVERVRSVFGGEVWAVLRLDGPVLPPHAPALFATADAVVLDAKAGGHTWGGTGMTLDWDALAPALDGVRGTTPLVLAGGLRPENVGESIARIAPDVVDVASGVERAPGIKDHDRVRRFAEAVAAAQDARVTRSIGDIT